MPLPSQFAYGPRPDYIGGVSQAGAGLAKVADEYAPASPNIQQLLRAVVSRQMSPFEASVIARAGKQQPPPNMPDAGPTQAQPSMPPMQAQRGPWTAGYDKGPPPPSRTPGPWGGGYDAGPPQAQFEEDITVQAPAPQQPQAAPSGELDLLSSPIRNRDVPTLMQLAGMGNKSAVNDLRELELALRARGLDDQMTRHYDQEVHRGVGDEAKRAKTAALPIELGLKERHAGMRQQGLNLTAKGLDTRRTQAYLAGTAETAQAIPQLRSILSDLKFSPGVAPSDWDYIARKTSRIMGGAPFIGNMMKEGFETVADTALTPEQYQIRSRIAQAVQPYRKLAVGTQITPGEFMLIDLITGQGLNVGDQIAALTALERSMTARQGRYEAGYPEMPGRIPMARPEDVMPPLQNPYPSGFGREQPRPIGPETEGGGDLDLLLQGGR